MAACFALQAGFIAHAKNSRQRRCRKNYKRYKHFPHLFVSGWILDSALQVNFCVCLHGEVGASLNAAGTLGSSCQKLTQHKRQDAAVTVVIDFNRRIDSQ